MSVINLAMVLTLLFIGIACNYPAAEVTDVDDIVLFHGICDGSAAVRVGEDQLLVAYDEVNEVYLFDSHGGEVKSSYSLQQILPLADKTEMDLEAAVLHGDGIWWVGSHGLDSDANDAPNRRVLFQTGLPQLQGDKLVLHSAVHDISTLIEQVVGESSGRLAPKKGGVSVEGLSVTLQGDLLVALRSPLTNGLQGDAYVVQITLRNGVFELVNSYALPLTNRGIRDLVKSDNGYLLLAGDIAGGGIFSLYHWLPDGDPDSDLVEIKNIPSDFNAEALVDMDSYWMVLSDDGKVRRPDSSAKDGDRRCDKIFKNASGKSISSVYFRAMKFTPEI